MSSADRPSVPAPSAKRLDHARQAFRAAHRALDDARDELLLAQMRAARDQGGRDQ